MEVTPQNAGCFDPVTTTVNGNEIVLPPAAAAVIELTLSEKS